MNRYKILVTSLLLITGCTSNEKKGTIPQKKTVSTVETVSEKKPFSTLIETQIFDFDNNGVLDTFSIRTLYDSKTVDINMNGTTYSFESVSVSFDTIKNKHIQNVNQLKSQYFILFKTENNKPLLYLKDKGDFAGAVNLILGFKENKFEILLNEQHEPVAIENDPLGTYLIVKETGSEPGFDKGYTYVNYQKYRAYNLSAKTMKFDSLKSYRYNLKNNKDFEKYFKMKNPVLGSKEENYRKYELFDLDTVK